MAKSKKDDKPYLPFYIGDWFKAPEIRAMPHANRMVWFEVLCLMWQSDERGYLTINHKPFVITNDITGEITKGQQVLASMLGVSYDFLQESFRMFKEYGVYSVREDGAIYSRFMVKLVDIQQKRGKAGKKGMENRYKKDNNFDITNGITNTENENPLLEDSSKKVGSVREELEVTVREESGTQKKEVVDKAMLIWMYGVNDLELTETKTNEMYIVQEMMKIWMQNFPEYYPDQSKDYPALLTMAYKIAGKQHWKKESILNINFKPCCEEWGKIVAFARGHRYFGTCSLSTINHKFQDVNQTMYQTSKNGTIFNHTSTTTQQPKPSKDDAAQRLYERTISRIIQ